MAVVKVAVAYHIIVCVYLVFGVQLIIYNPRKSARVRLLFYTVVKLVLGVRRGCSIPG